MGHLTTSKGCWGCTRAITRTPGRKKKPELPPPPECLENSRILHKRCENYLIADGMGPRPPMQLYMSVCSAFPLWAANLWGLDSTHKMKLSTANCRCLSSLPLDWKFQSNGAVEGGLQNGGSGSPGTALCLPLRKLHIFANMCLHWTAALWVFQVFCQHVTGHVGQLLTWQV